MKSLNIGYTTCFLDVSGVSRINFDILVRLKSRGHRIYVITTEGIGEWDQMCESLINAPMHLNLIDEECREGKFLEFIKENHIDIIFNTHSLWVYTHITFIKEHLPGVKIVDSLHLLDLNFMSGGFPLLSASENIHPYIDHTILISEDLKGYLFKYHRVDAAKFTVIKNGIDTEKFKADESQKFQFKNELNLSKNSKLIGFIGRLGAQKRPLFFLEIAACLSSSDPLLSFYMIGSGEVTMIEEVIGFVKQHHLQNRVYLLPNRNDIETVLNSTDLLLVPSLYEGSPLVILEAMLTETPVIATNVGAINEYVEMHCQLIPRAGEKEELKMFIEKIRAYSTDKQKLQSAAEHVKKNFDITNTAKEYERVFFKIL